jgi:hypothetical protein
MPEAKDGIVEQVDEPYVWMDVGHVNGVLADNVTVQKGMVAVNPDTGMVLVGQPRYPVHEPEAPPPEPPETRGHKGS